MGETRRRVERTPVGPEHPPRTPDPVGSDPPESPAPGLQGMGREVEGRREKGRRWRGTLFPPLGCTIWSCIGVIFTESNKTTLSFMIKSVHCTGLYLKYFLIQIQIQK